MKRIFAVIFALALACTSMVLVAGCDNGGGGQPSDLAGTWVPKEIDNGSTVTSMDDLESMGISPEQFMALDLNADGTAALTAFGEPVVDGESSLKWSATSSGVALEAGGQKIDMPYDSSTGLLTLEMNGQKITFTKK